MQNKIVRYDSKCRLTTALQPLAEEAGKKFMEKNSNVSIQVQGGGSGTGINQVASGAVQIGNSDVPSADKKDANKAKELVDNKVAGIRTCRK